MTSPVLLTREAHLEGLRAAVVALVRWGDRAGLRAPVPTTPDWDVRRLVAHQGMVHRWAAGIVTGTDVDVEAVERTGRSAADPLEWLRDGAIEVVSAISGAPDDLDALVFLADAPPPRDFWARRQCHETTIHAVDALAAALGRHPKASDADWITEEVALDGIDELLMGFLPRPVSRLRSEDPQRVVVRPEGSALAWVVDVSGAPPVTTRCPAAAGPAGDVLLEGGPVSLYLTLWNRSDEVAPTDGWGLWADSAQVRWDS